MAPRWFSKERHSFFDDGGGGNSTDNKSSPGVLVFLERLLLRLGYLVVVGGNGVHLIDIDIDIDIGCIINVLMSQLANILALSSSKDDAAMPCRRSLRRRPDSELDRSRPRFVLSSGSMRRRLRPEPSLVPDSVPHDDDGDGGDGDGGDEDLFPCYILQSGVYRWKGR